MATTKKQPVKKAARKAPKMELNPTDVLARESEMLNAAYREMNPDVPIEWNDPTLSVFSDKPRVIADFLAQSRQDQNTIIGDLIDAVRNDRKEQFEKLISSENEINLSLRELDQILSK